LAYALGLIVQNHVATNWKLGLALSLVAVVFWGVLPLALSIALTGADPYTVTWFRFTVATVVLGAVMSVTRNLPSLRSMTHFSWMLLVIAVLGLAGNYVLFLLALSLTKHIGHNQRNLLKDQEKIAESQRTLRLRRELS
jgi:hypothetical protein